MKKFNNAKKPYRRYDRAPPVRFIEKDPSKVDMTALLESFDKMTVKARPNEHPEALIRRFKRLVENSGLLGELKKREKKEKAKKRFLKNKAKVDARDRDRE